MTVWAKRQQRIAAAFSVLFIVMIASTGAAAEDRRLSRGQTLYVPVYSHIYSGDRERPVYLAVTVSIRNSDLQHAITVTDVDYYNSEGRRLQRYLDRPIDLPPMATVRYVVKESDKAGGSGANFIVRWQSAAPVNPPIAESIMISTASQLGISFSSRAVPIVETRPAKGP
jgi:hypothetical protein